MLTFIVQISHPYVTPGKTIALTRWTFVGKVMSLLFNMLSWFVITFLPRSKRLLFHGCSHRPQWFWSSRKCLSLFPLFPHLFAMKWWDRPLGGAQISHPSVNYSTCKEVASRHWIDWSSPRTQLGHCARAWNFLYAERKGKHNSFWGSYIAGLSLIEFLGK